MDRFPKVPEETINMGSHELAKILLNNSDLPFVVQVFGHISIHIEKVDIGRMQVSTHDENISIITKCIVLNQQEE